MDLKNITLNNLSNFTPEQLQHIVANKHAVSNEIVEKATVLIPQQVEERRNEIRKKLELLNKQVVGSLHFEMNTINLSGFDLTYGGSFVSPYYGYDIEIIFEFVFHYSGTFWSFDINTEKPFIRLATKEEQANFNAKFELIQFAQTFIIQPEEQKPIYISAQNIHVKYR